MGKIFKFKTEEQLTEFDNKYNYSGCLSNCTSVWLYGEGTSKWFGIQYCGDKWQMNHKVGDEWKHFDFYPTNYNEFTDFINKKINNNNE